MNEIHWWYFTQEKKKASDDDRFEKCMLKENESFFIRFCCFLATKTDNCLQNWLFQSGDAKSWIWKSENNIKDVSDSVCRLQTNVESNKWTDFCSIIQGFEKTRSAI